MIYVNQKGYSLHSGVRAVFQSLDGRHLEKAELVDAFSGSTAG